MTGDSTSVIITATTPAHFQAAALLIQEYQQDLGEDLCFQGFQKELEQLGVTYGPPRGCLLLAYLDGQYIGCGGLRQKRREGTCEMKRLYVQKAFRGLQTGRQLAVGLLDAAVRLGYDTMVLDTLERLQPAVRLYETLGFERCSPYYNNPLPGVVFMEKKLGDFSEKKAP